MFESDAIVRIACGLAAVSLLSGCQIYTTEAMEKSEARQLCDFVAAGYLGLLSDGTTVGYRRDGALALMVYNCIILPAEIEEKYRMF
ncbi:MAG: hypothetical protein F9K24_21490 [Leptonema illini]|uniref:Uncharacterized protein n=1 Tax=Leptonema illini TaxID=183 RepID=A0A833GX95_9LEPT|nr:MAG: hypothetical protein F9K24_21490 [Leptonema illini]